MPTAKSKNNKRLRAHFLERYYEYLEYLDRFWYGEYMLRLINEPCVYCFKPAGKNKSVDHLVPRSQGGTRRADNMAPACGKCNVRRDVKPILVFLVERGRI